MTADRAREKAREIVQAWFERGTDALASGPHETPVITESLVELIAAAITEAEPQWRFDMENAPRDGTRIIAWCRHENWQFAKSDEERADWEGPVFATWTKFNSGGWVWHGHSGTFIAWMPEPQPFARKGGKDG